VNVSVNRAGAARGARCEVKNLNSAKFAQVAVGARRRRRLKRP
jgi:aspartyl-tRNA(Asn)/glutamyl-tRNA(Gln) amidotransferase subunit B